jgi:arylsulfatase A-like enzyme
VTHPPNILLILTDQQRHDCAGFAGSPDVRTPHLDTLARDAVHFPNTFCAYPVCTPSRYSLLSGLPVRAHGGWSNRCTLAPAIPTFPRLLRDAGYRTAAVGKMHFTPTYRDAGFQQLTLAEQDGDGRFDDDYHRDLMAHGLLDTIDLIDQRREFRECAPQAYWDTFGAQPSNLPEEWHSTTWIADRALDRLEGWEGSGNLLMAGFIKPHHPFDPPSPWARMYDPEVLTLLPGWTEELPPFDRVYHTGYFPNDALSEPALRRVMAHYYATISQIDHHVGRLLDRLKQRGLYDDTLILFASDHGDYMGYHHMLLKGGPMYEPLVRVPLLIKFPGSPGAGERRDTLASLVDVAPTLLWQAGLTPAAGISGLDLADPHAHRPMLFAEDRRGAVLMARSATHKLLLAREPELSQFFDLQADPHELNNRFADPTCRDAIQEHREALAHWALFDALPPVCLDEAAPTLRQPDAEHRERVRQYSEQKVGEYLAGQ